MFGEGSCRGANLFITTINYPGVALSSFGGHQLILLFLRHQVSSTEFLVPSLCHTLHSLLPQHTHTHTWIFSIHSNSLPPLDSQAVVLSKATSSALEIFRRTKHRCSHLLPLPLLDKKASGPSCKRRKERHSMGWIPGDSSLPFIPSL